MNNLDIASEFINLAKQKGVAADIMIIDTKKIAVAQRMMYAEQVNYAHNKQILLRVIKEKHCVTLTTNNHTQLPDILHKAFAMIEVTSKDIYVSLAQNTPNTVEDLEIFYPCENITELLYEKVYLAEAAALSHSGITNSDGVRGTHSERETVIANTNGFLDSYKQTTYSIYMEVIAGSGKNKENGYEYLVVCNSAELENIEELGNSAAQRAIKRLYPRVPNTCQVPVVFENRIAGTLLSNFANAVSGVKVARQESFLCKSLGQEIFNRNISIIDDPLMKNSSASRPFDDEGVYGQKMALIDNGILCNWLLDTRSAKQLNLSTNGRASRNDSGIIIPTVSNMYMYTNNPSSLKELLSDIKEGLYVTEVQGFGIDLVSGNYSQGINGFWIVNGELAYPVCNTTIAGNLSSMFKELVAVDDLTFRYNINSPTVMIPNTMMVAGK